MRTTVLHCFLIGWTTCKKRVDQISYRTVTVPDASEDDFLPTPVVQHPPPAAMTTPTPPAPVLGRFSRRRNPPDRFSPK